MTKFDLDIIQYVTYMGDEDYHDSYTLTVESTDRESALRETFRVTDDWDVEDFTDYLVGEVHRVDDTGLNHRGTIVHITEYVEPDYPECNVLGCDSPYLCPDCNENY